MKTIRDEIQEEIKASRKIKAKTANIIIKCDTCGISKKGSEFHFINRTNERGTTCKTCSYKSILKGYKRK